MFTAYHASLCSFVQSYVRAPDVAEELVQTVFLRIWEHRAEWQPTGLRAYLFAACRNGALSYCRHERIVTRFETRLSRGNVDPRSAHALSAPDEELHAAELAAALRRAVHELPERRRQVVILRWEHHLSHSEIARILGISIKTVEVQFGRAVASLRKRLQAFRT